MKCTILALFVALLSLGSGPAYAAIHQVTAVVFEDANADGVRQIGEIGLPGIRLTNGTEISLTGTDGAIGLTVDTSLYRFATMTVPSGYRSTTNWYHWFDPSLAAPDTVQFGLAVDLSRASSVFSWVHVTDTQITTSLSYEFGADLAAISEIQDAPLFIMNTGDVVDDGDSVAEWEYYAGQIATSEIPVLHVVGNHDDMPSTRMLDLYEQYVGPPYYSFEIGNWHFVGYNNWEEATSTPAQAQWLAADAASVPDGMVRALFNHFTVRESATAVVDRWEDAGISSVFSGHHHSTNLSVAPNGMGDYTLVYARGGGRDWTPRACNVVTSHPDGTMEFDFRPLGADHRAAISSPAEGAIIHGDLMVNVQTYDSSVACGQLEYFVTGPGGENLAQGFCDRTSYSGWQSFVTTDGWAEGTCELRVSGAFEDGTGISLLTSFVIGDGPPQNPAPIDDWPMFRRTPDGASSTDRLLVPPLEPVWSRPLPGMVAHNSPVVANGRVFMGCREIGSMRRAGISAFDAASGTPLWEVALPGGVALAPAIIDGTVLANALNDSIYGLDPATGATRWSIALPGGAFNQAAPTGRPGGVFVGGKPRGYLVDPASGTVIWQTPYIGQTWFEHVYTAAAFADDRVFLNTFGGLGVSGGLDIIDLATGGKLIATMTGCYRAPIWTGNDLFVVGNPAYYSQSAQVLDSIGGVVWTSMADIRRGMGAPAFSNGRFVFAGRNGVITCIAASDGSILWTVPVGESRLDMIHGQIGGSQTLATPAIAGEIVYIGSLDGQLYAISLNSGEVLWSWDLGMPIASSAALSGNMLFVGCSDGQIYGFRGTSDFVAGTVEDDDPAATKLHFRAAPRSADGQEIAFTWTMADRQAVEIAIFDVRGARLGTVVKGIYPAGSQRATWRGQDDSGRRLAAGVYLARITSGTQKETAKIVLVH